MTTVCVFENEDKTIKKDGQSATSVWHTKISFPRVCDKLLCNRPKPGMRDILFHGYNARLHES